MTSDNSDTLKLTIDERDLEKKFCKIYGSVIANYFVFNKQLISDVEEILNSEKVQNYKTDLPSYQLAFLLTFGIQDTCLAVQKFHESIKDYTKIIKKFSKINLIELSCIECESLPTVVGVCQVIDEIFEQFGSASKFAYREILVSVSDERQNWRCLCGCIVDTVNSYFKHIQLTLDFGFSVQFIDRVKESDLVIYARVFTEYKHLTIDYFLQVVLNEMKNDAILFYFDSSSEKYYASLRHLISTMNSLAEVTSCKSLFEPFDDLNYHYYLDLPIKWVTSFRPVMVSVCIKYSETRDNKTENKDVQSTSYIAKQPNTLKKQKTVPKEKKDVKQTKTSRYLDVSDVQTDTSKEIYIPDTLSIHDALNKQMNISKTNKKAKSSQNTKCEKILSDIAISQQLISSQIEPKSAVYQVNSPLSSKNQIAGVTEPNIKTKAASLKVPHTSDWNVILHTKEKQTALSKQVQNRNTSTSMTNAAAFKKGNKSKSSETSAKNKSASIITVWNANDEMISSKKKTAVLATQTQKSKTGCFVKSNDDKKSSIENASISETQKFKPTNVIKPVKLTKESIKCNPKQKIRLTGKFAHMDLEKKNKDERHRMRAKQASFSKYANFDYDD